MVTKSERLMQIMKRFNAQEFHVSEIEKLFRITTKKAYQFCGNNRRGDKLLSVKGKKGMYKVNPKLLNGKAKPVNNDKLLIVNDYSEQLSDLTMVLDKEFVDAYADKFVKLPNMQELFAEFVRNELYALLHKNLDS